MIRTLAALTATAIALTAGPALANGRWTEIGGLRGGITVYFDSGTLQRDWRGFTVTVKSEDPERGRIIVSDVTIDCPTETVSSEGVSYTTGGAVKVSLPARPIMSGSYPSVLARMYCR